MTTHTLRVKVMHDKRTYRDIDSNQFYNKPSLKFTSKNLVEIACFIYW